LLLLFISIGCQQSLNDSLSDLEGSIELRSSCDSSYTAGNSNNQHDSIGIDHNDALDYAADSALALETADSTYFNALKDFTSTLFATTSYDDWVDTLTQEGLDLLIIDSIDIIQTIRIENFINKYVDEQETEYIWFLRRIDTIIQNATHVQAAIDSMKNVEIEIKNSNFNAEDKESFLSGASIFRHSLKYWSEARYNNCHPYHDNVHDVYVEVGEPLGIDWYRVLIDVLTYNDCMANGGYGSPNSQTATQRCFKSGVYASSRAYDPIFIQD
jgi:hypothetical protein